MSEPISPNRNSIRSAIFNGTNMKPKEKEIDFFGQKIVIKQLNLDTILSFRSSESSAKERMVDTIVAYAYVPGTEDKVFEEADKDSLLAMPFGADFQRLQAAITELTSVDLGTKEAEKNLVGTDSVTS